MASPLSYPEEVSYSFYRGAFLPSSNERVLHLSPKLELKPGEGLLGSLICTL